MVGLTLLAFGVGAMVVHQRPRRTETDVRKIVDASSCSGGGGRAASACSGASEESRRAVWHPRVEVHGGLG